MKRRRVSLGRARRGRRGPRHDARDGRSSPARSDARRPDHAGRPRPLKLTVYATGELRAGRTASLVAPSAGGTLRLVKLVPTGLPVKAGDVVFEIDPADQEFALRQSKSELAEAEQQIVKMKADSAVQAAEDKWRC